MIVFIATRPHHVTYFQALAPHLPVSSRVLRYPRVPFDALLPSPAGARLDVGQLVESHMRRKLARNQNFTPSAWLFKRLLLRIAAWLHARHFRQLAASPDTNAIAVWNGSGWVAQCAIFAARTNRKPVLHFENGLLPGTTTIDAAGVNACNSVPRDPARFRGLWHGGEIPLSLPAGGHRTTLPPTALPPRFVWVPFQIDSDSQILRHSPWISDMRALFAVLERLVPLAQELGLAFICKEHPASTVAYPDLRRRQSNHLRFANAESTEELIRRAVGVITINSTAGLEALLMYKPVIALGEAFYALPGLAEQGRSVSDLERWLAGLPCSKIDRDLVSGFHHYLHSCYCVPGNWKAPDQAHLSAASRRVMELLTTDKRIKERGE